MDHASEYEKALREWAELTRMGGSPARANARVKRMQRSMLVLRNTADGRKSIEQLATDPDPKVRGWAATAMLLWDPRKARQILVELRDADYPSTPGPSASFDAKWTLIELDRGQLKVDWDPDAPRRPKTRVTLRDAG